MTTFSSVALVPPVRHLVEAVARTSGWALLLQLFEGGDYAFAFRGEVDLHLATVERVQPDESTVAVFLYVGDAHASHHDWMDVVVDGRLVPPVDTNDGLVEGAYVDPGRQPPQIRVAATGPVS